MRQLLVVLVEDHILIDGKEEKQYDGIMKDSIIKFGPDGSYQYLAQKGNGIYLLTQGAY